MKTKIQQFNQHYMVPLVLAMGMVSLVLFFYHISEWLNTPALSGHNTFYYYEGEGSWKDYQQSQQFSTLTYLLSILVCSWAAMGKNKWISLLAIITCLVIFSI